MAQTALSVVLLTGAGLFLKSLHNIRALDLGLDPDNVLVATVDFDGTGRTDCEVAAFFDRALEHVEVLPGVERASLAMSVPLRSARAGFIRAAGSAGRITAPGATRPTSTTSRPASSRRPGPGLSRDATSSRTSGMARRSSW